jgi:arylamine N-acetyltransferase
MVILVTITGLKYRVSPPSILRPPPSPPKPPFLSKVDVGFGSQGALRSIPLIPSSLVQSVPGLEGRLSYRPIAPLTQSSQKMWLFETRNTTSQTWNPGYCFSELEFLPEDFVNFNYKTSRDPLSWFTYRFVVTRVLLDEKRRRRWGV